MSDKEKWDNGFKDGFAHVVNTGVPNGKGWASYKVPNDFYHRGDLYSRGFAEGMISGNSHPKFNKILPTKIP